MLIVLCRSFAEYSFTYSVHSNFTLYNICIYSFQSRKLLRIQRRGATMALTSLATYFGDELPDKLPKLWEFITQPFEKVMTDAGRFINFFIYQNNNIITFVLQCEILLNFRNHNIFSLCAIRYKHIL